MIDTIANVIAWGVAVAFVVGAGFLVLAGDHASGSANGRERASAGTFYALALLLWFVALALYWRLTH